MRKKTSKKSYISFKKKFYCKNNFLTSYIKFNRDFSGCSSTCGSDCSFGCRCRFRSAPSSSFPLPVPEVVLHAAFVHRTLRRSLCASLWVHQQLHISNLEKHRYMILVYTPISTILLISLQIFIISNSQISLNFTPLSICGNTI